jgi:hypothetical protein
MIRITGIGDHDRPDCLITMTGIRRPVRDLLAEVPDPRRAQGKLYRLPHVLLFSILAIVTGCNSSRGIVTFIDVHRRRLNEAFGLTWRRAPAHTAIRYILQRLDPAAVEASFRRHAALRGSIKLDGKTLRGSFDNFRDHAAAQVLSAFATDTALVLGSGHESALRVRLVRTNGEYQAASSENRSRNGLSRSGVGWALSAQM